MHSFLEMALQGQLGKHRFDVHVDVLLAPLANPDVFRMQFFLDKALINGQHHLSDIALGDLLKSAPIVDVGCGHNPIHDVTQMIEHETQFASYDPTPVRRPFLTDLVFAAAFPARVE